MSLFVPQAKLLTYCLLFFLKVSHDINQEAIAASSTSPFNSTSFATSRSSTKNDMSRATSRSFAENDASRAKSRPSKENDEENKKSFTRQPFSIGPSFPAKSASIGKTQEAIAASSSSAFTSTSSFVSSDTIHSSSAMSTSSLKNPSVVLSDTSRSTFTSSTALDRRQARKDHYEKLAKQAEFQRSNGVGEDCNDLSYESNFCQTVGSSLSSAKSSKSHSNSGDWQCHKCNELNPSSKSRCGGKRVGSGRPCLAWIGGKALVHTDVKDQKRKRGADSHLHISKGGSGGNISNARRELQGGNVLLLTLQAANNSETNMVVHLDSELQLLLPAPYNTGDGLVVSNGDNAMNKICDILSLRRGCPNVSERRSTYINSLTQLGAIVVTGVTIPGKTPDSIKEKMVVFPPNGIAMTEADVAKLKCSADSRGCVTSLCKEDCFGIPEEGKKTCSEHTVEVVRLLSQHLSHFSFQHVLMFFMFIYIHRNVLSAAVQKFIFEACVNLVIGMLTTYDTMVKFVIILAALQSAVETALASIAQRNARVR